ncbi:MAG: hypothetical protein M3Z92_00235 [Bacteroidota bacterium]|nr:hypothetical protein [Bacteroidota bacterium]
MKPLQVIIEKGDNGLYGRIEGRKSYLPVTFGNSKKEVLQNLKELIKDYQKNEKNGDSFWLKLNTETLQFEVVYDIQAFFKDHDFLNASAIARHADINESLVRQYATGKKYPSAEQAKKLEDAIRNITKELHKVSFYVGV